MSADVREKLSELQASESDLLKGSYTMSKQLQASHSELEIVRAAAAQAEEARVEAVAGRQSAEAAAAEAEMWRQSAEAAAAEAEVGQLSAEEAAAAGRRAAAASLAATAALAAAAEGDQLTMSKQLHALEGELENMRIAMEDRAGPFISNSIYTRCWFLVSKLWNPSPFDQSEASISNIPSTDSPKLRPGCDSSISGR